MRKRMTNWLGLATLALFLMAGLAAQATAQGAANVSVDYKGFSELVEVAETHRADRLIDLDVFNALKDEPDTLILDTRSREAYDWGHIDGAVHLNFSDLTEIDLAEIIPSKDTRILIYCNNNFVDNVRPVIAKRAPLALNIPTFINLYGYGYENIYELEGQYSLSDTRIGWKAAHRLQEN